MQHISLSLASQALGMCLFVHVLRYNRICSVRRPVCPQRLTSQTRSVLAFSSTTLAAAPTLSVTYMPKMLYSSTAKVLMPRAPGHTYPAAAAAIVAAAATAGPQQQQECQAVDIRHQRMSVLHTL
jgi:hypothetical protein